MKKIYMTVFAGSQCVLLATAIAVAQIPARGNAQETNTPARTPVKDFSKGFAAFSKLGVPDASKAEYVNLNAYNRDPYSMMDSTLYELRLAGNAWMLEETPKVKGRFIMAGLSIIEVYDNEALMKEQRKKWEDAQKTNTSARALNILNEQDDRLSGQWKKVDLKKDVEKTVTFLSKEDKSGNRHDRLSYGDGYGTLFLNAFHYHSRGFTNEANLIVSKLFERAGDPKKVIGQAMEKIAGNRYNEILKAFKADGNWASFGTSLDAVTAQFAANWKQAPAVRKLSELVKQRVTQQQAPPLAGEGLTDQDKALAAELATAAPVKRSRYYGYDGGLWILPAPPRPGMPARTGEKDIIAGIKQKGMQAVPMLIALLKDEYLTRLDLTDISNTHTSYSFDSREAGEEMIEKMFKAMKRPARRCDIASELLKQLLLKKDDSRGNSSDAEGDDLIEEIKAWYAACKNKTPVELACTYLEGGDNNQQRVAIQYLMKAGKDADMDKIEKHFLSGKGSRTDTYIVREYVQERGEKARAFLEKYEAFIKNRQSAPDDNEMFKNDAARKQMEAELTALKELVTVGSLKVILEQVVTGVKTMQEVEASLYRKLASEKPADAVTVLLDSALKVKDADVSAGLLSMAPYAQRTAGGRFFCAEIGDTDEIEPDEQHAGPAKKDKPAKLVITQHAAQWKQLLADKRKIDDFFPGQELTVADAAATTINSMYGAPEGPRNPYERSVTPSLGRRSLAIALAKAEGLLAGKPESELPKAPVLADLTPEKRRLVVAKIMQAADASIAQTVAGLSNEEHLALLLEARKDQKLNAKLASFANTVRDIEADTALAPAVKELEAAKDKVLNREVVDKVLKACTRFTGEGKIITCMITRRICLDGVIIKIREITPGSREFTDMLEAGLLRPDQPAEVSGSVAATACQGSALWAPGAQAVNAASVASPGLMPEDKLIDRMVGELESDLAAKMVADQESFWKSVADFCAGKGNVCRTGVILFSGKCPVKVAPKAAVPAAATPTAAAGINAQRESLKK